MYIQLQSLKTADYLKFRKKMLIHLINTKSYLTIKYTKNKFL